MGNALSLIITVIIPTILAFLLWWFTRDEISSRFENFRTERYTKKRKSIFLSATPQRVQEWLNEYYTSKGQSDSLYMMRTLPTKPLIPFLTNDEWLLTGQKHETLFIFQEQHQISSIQHDSTFIERRKRLFGQRLWNQKIYCAKRLINSDDGFQIEVGFGDYFQFLSACGPLADEILFAIAFNKKKTPYRDQKAQSLNVIKTFPCKAHAIGIHSLVIGKRNDGKYSTILHKRSEEVAINSGTLTGVPTYTFQPHSDQDEYDRDIFHSFLREYLEELYDKDEFIRDKADSSRPRANWWYELPEIKSILELQKLGSASFHLLGFGFDPSHCDLVICVCFIIEEVDYWEKALGEMIKSWEASSEAFKQEYLLFSKDIDELIVRRSIQPGTAYCLDKARLLLTAKESKPTRRKKTPGKSKRT